MAGGGFLDFRVVPNATAPDVSRDAAGRPWVERTALLDELRRHADASVVVISAPAGSGKSTLATQWLSTDDRKHATVSIEPYVDEPAQLATLLLAALGTIGPRTHQAMQSATADEPTLSSVLIPGLSALAGARRHPYLLVIDDVHLLHDPRCHDVVAAVCRGVPIDSQVAILTRDAPPAWLSRGRAEGTVFELDGHDLAFDSQEAGLLMKDLGLDVSPEAIQSLVDESEGWAVGICLSAVAKQSRGAAGGLSGIVGDGADRYVVDYIGDQVLSNLDESDREFLVATSILDDVTAPACDTLLGASDSATTLARLHRTVQLVIALDGTGTRFRYHHLLQKALRTTLATERPEAVPDLHRRAAAWYGSTGDLDTAVRHAKAAGDLSLTAQLIWSDLAGCVGSGRPDRLRLWLSGLTEQQVVSDRWLVLAAAWLGVQTGDAKLRDRRVLQAESLAGRQWRTAARDDEYAAQLATLHAVLGLGGLRDAVSLCDASLSGLPADSPFRTAALFIRGVALTLLGDTAEGLSSLERADQLARALSVPLIESDTISWRGVLAIVAGDHDEGIGLIRRASEIIAAHDLDRLATAAHSTTSQALMQALVGDRRAATVSLGTALRLSAMVEGIVPWFGVCGRLIQARTAALLGDGALARRLIWEASGRMTPELAGSLAATLLGDSQKALRELAVDGGLAGSLTTAELRVLQFLPSHLTFPQIAERLFLSTNTVKTQALSVYRKFGVTSRAAAVTRAESLGLVEAALRS